MRVALILVGSALVLAACGPAKPTRDKAYFTAHTQERAQALSDCRNNPGQLGATPDCVNAIQSDADAEHDRVFRPAAPPQPGVTNAGHL